MPLSHYGVAIGTLQSFTRDPQHQYGSWYSGALDYVRSPSLRDGLVVAWLRRA